ncbi:MAG: hypothetical protein QM703_00200 [Gemmatales bacterium]
MRYWLPLLILSVGSLALAQDGKLDSIRQDVRAPRNDSSGSSSSSSSSSSFGSDDPEVSLFFAKLGFYVVTSPFTIPPAILCDHYDTPATFVAYPYAENWKGLMQFGMESHKIDDVVPITWENLMSLRASVEEGNNFNGINRLGVTFLVDTMTRFGISGKVNFYEEKTATTLDQLTIGDLNLLFRFAQSERAQYHAGVGIRFLNDRQQTDTGVNFVYGFDCFPIKPVSLGMQFEFGTLGNAWVYQATGRIGLVWKFSEVYAGYDYFHIGSQVLQGPMVGLRIWF